MGSYFELSDKNEKWVFPIPGSLEGVKSRGRTIMKMNDVTFKYPSHEKNTIEKVSLTACMASRVAVVGANGAGKSTAIKLLIGELKPLTQPGVEKALKDFGLDAEAGSHSPIQSLSHGQKVKVVICASCWQNPHLIILDEPTNYLDRDGLGA